MQTVNLIAMSAGLTAVVFIALAAFASHTKRGRVANVGNDIFRTRPPARARPKRHGRNVIHVITRARGE